MSNALLKGLKCKNFSTESRQTFSIVKRPNKLIRVWELPLYIKVLEDFLEKY